MAEELPRLKSIRAAYKGHCTRNMNQATTIMTSAEPSIDDLETILERLSTRLDAISLVDQKIEAKVADAELEREIEDALAYNDEVTSFKKRISKFVLAKTKKVPVSAVNTSATASIRQSPTTVKLPKITMKEFSGDPLEWLTFWDSFEASIHKNANISDVDKMNYLKGFLRGEASRAIDGLSLSNHNYDTAIEILKIRFGQTQIQINAYMEALLKLPATTSDVKKMRAFYDASENYMRSLEALDVTRDSYGCLLLPVMLKKLPEEVRRIIQRKCSKGEPLTLKTMRESLQEEIEAREKSKVEQIGTDLDTSWKDGILPSKVTPTSAFFVEGSNKDDDARSCIFCGKRHDSEACRTVTSHDHRVKMLRKEGRCFNCFKRNHLLRSCTSKRKCRKCGGKHHSAICRPKEDKGDATKDPPVGDTTGNQKAEEIKSLSVITKGTILLQSALVRVMSGCRSTQARILFDSGSQRTFISKRLATYLNCQPVGGETLALSTFGSTEATVGNFQLVIVKLITKEDQIQIDALVSPSIAAPMTVQLAENWQNYPELQGLELADNMKNEGPVNIDIVIGNDHYASLITGEVIKAGAMLAMKSKFGWLLSGRNDSSRGSGNAACFKIGVSPPTDVSLESMLQRFWEIDSLGIVENKDTEDEVMLQFKNSIRFDESSKRYSVRLPWKDQVKEIPSNYAMSKRRLYCLVKRLRKIERIKEYDDLLQEQLKSGIIEKIDDPTKSMGVVVYLPHFAVVKNESVTTKLRVVYDASARASKSSPSLNDMLHTGPSLLPEVTTILMKFRMFEVAMVADIEKAFLQIAIAEEDRDATRFMWLKDVKKQSFEENLQHFRFQRVLFGASSSPFILNATLKYHLSLQPPDDWVAEDMANSWYADNLATSVQTEENSYHYYNRARSICSAAGLNLRQWMTNSPSLNKKLIEDGMASEEHIKVLGLKWNCDDDTLKIAASKLAKEINTLHTIHTKRSVCSLAAKIFDPLGLVEPFVVKAKIMLQEIWKEKIDWDHTLPDSFQKEWASWLSDVEELENIAIPRRLSNVSTADVQEMELHTFCDSSLRAYGAVTYLRNHSGDYHVTLLMSKSRVSPLKKKTIPRLELLSAVVAVRLCRSVMKMLHPMKRAMKTIFWSDSQIVLHWIYSGGYPDQFVKRRVDEILQNSEASSWHYCPSKDNPADILSRGASVAILKKSLWYNGPVWLEQPEEGWPVWNTNMKKKMAEMEEAKLKTEDIEKIVTCMHVQKKDINELIPMDNFSTMKHLLKITSLVLRFIHNCKKNVDERRSGYVSSEEKTVALKMWLRAVQADSFAKELALLKRNKKNPAPPLVRQLGLYLDEDGIIRCLGRLQQAAVSKEAKHPVLLPKSSRFTKLMILTCHCRVLHGKTRDTLTEFRQGYWTPQGRQVVRSTIRKCVTCLKADGPCYRLPDAPPLPPARVTDGQPFQNTGVDYAGPLWVKSKTKDGVVYHKTYISLFTCAVIRAVHLEVVGDLTVGNFLQAFRRFISRRGVPEVIISDNAKNFRGAAKKLNQLSGTILDSAETQQFIFNKGIQWKFIAERAPWWGGFYERLIGTVKRCLKKNIGNAMLTKEELHTIIVEIEAVVNNRPLTYVYTEIGDGLPLTPSHFLSGRRLNALPEVSKRKEDPEFTPGVPAKELRSRLDYMDSRMRGFWQCWKKEYLLNLREYQMNVNTKQGTSLARVGDIVLIQGQSQRSSWKLGKIAKLLTGRDGAVRAAQVNQGKGQMLTRSLQHLYPLEIQDKTLIENEKLVEKDVTIESTQNRTSKRKAASKALEQIRSYGNSGGEDV